jgi:hypothetical protein
MKCLSQISRSFLLTLLLAFCLNSFSQTVIYSESFSVSSGGWTTTSTGPGTGAWVRGSNSSHSSGATGNYFYSQKYGSSYNNNTDITATSPAIDLTGYVSMTLDLKIWYSTESRYDGMKIEYSLNNGSSWNDLGSVSNSNWYNDTDVDAFNNNEDGWSGNSGGWLTGSINLSTEDIGFESATQARFRVLFASDYSITDTGVAFDEIFIRGTEATPTYCASTGNTSYRTGTRQVTFNSINNSSPIEFNAYSDYTYISTTVTRSTSYDLTVKVNTDGNYLTRTYAWIDWNQDLDFDDAGETYYLGTAVNQTNGNTSLSPISITIPTTASLGTTRMRVSTKYNNTPSACETGFDGEVEDYSINVIAAPSITTGTISPTTFCSGSSVNVPFTITGTFTSGNVFTAQLSNASGSFSSPVTIGTLTGTTSGTISATIPIATASGTGYRIRVVSSNPIVTGSNNGTNITINAIPNITGTTPAFRCGTGTVTLGSTASSGTINWYAASTGGIPLATGTSFTTPSISATTTYWVDANNASCTSSRTAVIATINTIPTITGITPASRCGTGTVTLGATASSGTINWYAASTGGSSLGTGNSFTTPSISATTSYWVDTTNGSCTTLTRTEVIASVSKNYWTGNADSNWNNPANWCSGVPTNGIEATLNTLIPSGLTNYPVISPTDSPGYVKTIEFENNTTLIITDNYLRVTENLKLNGKIDLEGEAQLIQDLGSTLDPTSSGTLERDQQGTADTYTYNYWSSPVGLPNNTTNNNSYKISDIFQGLNFITTGYNGSASPLGIADYWIWKFSNKTSGDYSQWQHVRSTGTMLAGEGFTMKGPGTGSITTPQNYVLLGKPNNGDINLTISAGNEYLVGNPYASALDANQFIRDNGDSGSGSTTGTLYFWEHWGGGSHYLADYQGGYATYTLAGGVPAASSGTSGTSTKTPGRYIPVAQGFFVTAQNTGTIKFNNGQRVFQVEDGTNSLFIKQLNSKTNKNAVSDTRTKLRLSFNSVNAIKRQLLMTVDSNSSINYDWGYDAPYIENLKDDAYWMIDSKKYTIQGIDKISESTIIPLGIHTKNDGWNTFNIDAIENDDNNLNVFLHDKTLNTYHNLKESSFKIYLPSGEYLNRFEITFNNNESLLTTNDVINKNIELYFSNEKQSIIINNPNNKVIKSVKINNILGQVITEFNINSTNNFLEVNAKNITIGTYVIALHTDMGVITKKVIIN